MFNKKIFYSGVALGLKIELELRGNTNAVGLSPSNSALKS